MMRMSCIDLLLICMSTSICDVLGDKVQTRDCVGSKCGLVERGSKHFALHTAMNEALIEMKGLDSSEQQGEFKGKEFIRNLDSLERRRGIVEALFIDIKRKGVDGDSANRMRKKRDVPGNGFIGESPQLAEEDLEKELREEVKSGASIQTAFNTINAYLRGLFLLPDARFNLRYLSNTETPNTADRSTQPGPRIGESSLNNTDPLSTELAKSNDKSSLIISPSIQLSNDSSISANTTSSNPVLVPDSPTLVLECSGPITSFCQTRRCRVKCIDGRKVEMVCGGNSLDIKTSNVGDGISRNTVSCSP